jgi:hypothetical protein
MDIRLTYLTGKLNRDARELYGFEAGIHPETPPPLSTFDPEDQQEFIK